MATISTRLVGKWFQTVDGRTFRVIAIDSYDETVEVQDSDGDLEEFDSETWSELEPMQISSPNDSYASFEGPDDGDEDVRTLSDVLGRIDHYEYH